MMKVRTDRCDRSNSLLTEKSQLVLSTDGRVVPDVNLPRLRRPTSESLYNILGEAKASVESSTTRAGRMTSVCAIKHAKEVSIKPRLVRDGSVFMNKQRGVNTM